MKAYQSLFSTISRPFSLVLNYTTSPNSRKPHNSDALRVLDLITPKPPKTQPSQTHLRLIQACMQDLLQQKLRQPLTTTNNNNNMFDEIPDRNESWGSLFFEIHKQGGKTEAVTLSCALSSITCLRTGVQLHCLAIKTGFGGYVYIGTCLISFYSKCGNLDEASKVFEEMPVRNVVSWTAIIAGFAQNWELCKCLELYNKMKCSTLKPNDYTFTSILSVCSGVGALSEGKGVHCQVIELGFDSYVHIGNVLISLYSKCGNVGEAYCVFERMQWKDLVSWNSMIAGYAQHGLAEEAIDLLNQMEQVKVKPDGITFLNVLSSCRHVGLIERGRYSFDSMIKHGVEPDLDHYSCMVDLLGRNGLVKEAKELIDKMPICPNAVIWGSLLSSCRLHGEVHIGIEAAERRLFLVPDCAATHVQLVNLYANAGCWEQAARVRKMMKDRGLKTNPGYSWIEIKNKVYRFRAEDKSSVRVYEILAVIDGLVDNMRQLGYVPKIYEEELDL